MHNIYGHVFPTRTQLNFNDSTEGETIETRCERIMTNGEGIGSDGAPIIYTERKDGVLPEYNIRTDRFDIAIEMTDQISKQAWAARKAFHDNLEAKNNPPTGGPTPETGAPSPATGQ